MAVWWLIVCARACIGIHWFTNRRLNHKRGWWRRGSARIGLKQRQPVAIVQLPWATHVNTHNGIYYNVQCTQQSSRFCAQEEPRVDLKLNCAKTDQPYVHTVSNALLFLFGAAFVPTPPLLLNAALRMRTKSVIHIPQLHIIFKATLVSFVRLALSARQPNGTVCPRDSAQTKIYMTITFGCESVRASERERDR